jgi:hypothetical protein
MEIDMTKRGTIIFLVLLLAGALLAACGSPEAEQAADQSAVELAVAATLTAVASGPAATDTEVAQAPTVTLAATGGPSGDGGNGDTATPPETTESVVTAAPQPSPTTELAATAVPPPSPTTELAATAVPPPSPTPVIVAVLPVDGGGNEFLNIRNANPVKDGRNVTLPGFSPAEVSEPMVFRDRMVFRVEVFDTNVGTTDGAGIDHVRFTITDDRGEQVYQRQENTPGYCVVVGGEPDCRVWVFVESGYRWPDGAQLSSGLHSVTIDIQPKNGELVQWFWSFQVEAPAASASSLAAQINGITLLDTGYYAVDFATVGFTPALPGQHVHFFFDTVAPEQAGLPGSGPWAVYGGPSPFTGYGAADRPAGATQMCILVANSDHSVQANTGNCFPLP